MATIKKPAKKMQEGGKVKIKIKIKPNRNSDKDKAPLMKYEASKAAKDYALDKASKDAGYKAAKDSINKISGMKKGGTIKKMQGGGVMNTKLKDIPGKVKSTVKKVADKVKNSSVGDAVNAATSGGYSAAKTIGRGVRAFRDQIGSINDRMPKKKMGGAVKAKNGKSFPDLNKDGKITKADILKGRGVIAKKGASIKKAQTGNNIKVNPPAGYTKGSGYKSFGKSGVSVKKMQYGGAAASMVPPMMKKGGTTKKCKYGCK
jgi:hypothetical protein